jgi:hypothetical protein
MSTINVDRIVDSSGGVLSPISSVNKNRIINGAMTIAQRGTAAVTTNLAFPVDRFSVGNVTDGAFSAQQDSSAPTGFVNSLKYTTTTADGSLTTTQNSTLIHHIEGTNVADLGFGTANAKTVTLSFWVRSSLTGTFGGSVKNSDNTRSYPFTYSISSADTWEQKSITIAGDTTGTWLTNTGRGITLNFGLGAGPDRSGTAGAWASANYNSATGATSVIGTLNATWYITGVQLEVGTQATSFEYRQYQQELALCQRYYYKLEAPGTGEVFSYAYANDATNGRALGSFPVTLRTEPTALEQTGTASNYTITTGGVSRTLNAVPAFNGATTQSVWFVSTTVASGQTAGLAGSFAGTGAYLAWSAEL